MVLAAAISRYASTFDGFFRGFVDAAVFSALMREDLRTGQHRNPGAHPSFFTTACFHTAEELGGELARRLAHPDQVQLLLDVLDVIERDPQMTNATAHLLAVGQRAG